MDMIKRMSFFCILRKNSDCRNGYTKNRNRPSSDSIKTNNKVNKNVGLLNGKQIACLIDLGIVLTIKDNIKSFNQAYPKIIANFMTCIFKISNAIVLPK